MRHLKSIFLALFISVVLLALAGVFLKSEYKVERSILIRANPSKVFLYLKDLRKWSEWSAWSKASDPLVIFNYQRKDLGEGAKQFWEGQSMEGGGIEITGFHAPKELFFKLKLEDGFTGNGSLLLDDQQEYTKVAWRMEGKVGNNIPQRYFILWMDKLIGPDMESVFPLSWNS